MQKQESFILFEPDEFVPWLQESITSRRIETIQQHHTWRPNYSHFTGANHFSLQHSMKNAHLERGFADIAQHFSIYPDGKICTGRSLDRIPAGIKGANTGAVCIESIGNFDAGTDEMTAAQEKSIVTVTAALLKHFNLEVNEQSNIYHHWYDLNTGNRTDGSGNTKSCPGTTFFGGNSVERCEQNFIPQVAAAVAGIAVAVPLATATALRVGRVTADRLNVRSGPSSKNGIVDVLRRAILINCYDIQRRWWRIHPTQNRWVYARYVVET